MISCTSLNLLFSFLHCHSLDEHQSRCCFGGSFFSSSLVALFFQFPVVYCFIPFDSFLENTIPEFFNVSQETVTVS